MKKNKGISLIALVITIVILLILASVSIVFLTGDNGVINKAKIAKELQKEVGEKEKKDLEAMNAFVKEIETGEIQAYPVSDKTPGELAGEGTEENPYLVESIEDLVAFSNIVNTGENLGKTYNDHSFTNKYVKLVQTLDFESDNSYMDPNSTAFGDINEDGIVDGIKVELTKKEARGFTPIGNEYILTKQEDGSYVVSGIFEGNFNGNSNMIKNLYINVSDKTTTKLSKNLPTIDYSASTWTSKSYYFGLFGVSNIGTRNSISNLGIDGEIFVEDISADAGSIVGRTNGSISNLYSKCNLTMKTNTSCRTAGIASTVYQSGANNCYFLGNINVDNAGTGSTLVGGVFVNCSNTAKNCYNKGNIIVKGNGNTYAGGIIAYINDVTIENCYNTGKVDITNNSTSAAIYVGGITGYTYSKIKILDSYNTGKIIAQTKAIIYEGGISGILMTNCEVDNCYNSGEITANGKGFYLGGIVGSIQNDIRITNSYNTAELSGKATTSNSTLGGIVGFGYNNNLIGNSYNTGNMTGNGPIVSAGGILGGNNIQSGKNYTMTVSSCYNKGNVKSIATSNAYASGIIGTAYKAILNSTYNIGKMEAEGSPKTTSGLMCYDSTSTATKSLYLKGIGGNDDSEIARNVITQADLLDWLNANRGENAEWEIRVGVNDGYPVLK